MPILFRDIRIIQDSDSEIPTISWSPGGVAEDLSGFSAQMKVRAAPSAAAVLSLTNTSGISLGGVAGTIDISITRSQALTLAPGTYYYDLTLTDTHSHTFQFAEGQFIVAYGWSQ